MDNKNPQDQNADTFQPEVSTPQPQLSQDAVPQISLRPEDKESIKASKTIKRFSIFAVIILIIIIVLVALFIHSISKPVSSVTPKTTSKNNSSSTSPLDNGSIKQQVQYCSNIVNANTVC
ncbi:MAG: hypothetical protein ACHQT9_03490 [Candidatus Saccharimonadales bacterium]